MEEQEPKSESTLTGLLRASESLLELEQPTHTLIPHLALRSSGVERVFREIASIYAGAEMEQLLDFMDPFSGHLNKSGGS